ncbi:type II toxin-antitoxin system HicA family toxin [Thiocapsa sp.]|uniref:type II toxin-antitoxin system HicA family toxin n=1 Tax=Thiocapsa sp. TaxID=2024551 RepID=UPI0035943024
MWRPVLRCWRLVRVKGSHHQFKHPTKPGLVTLKHPDSDIPAGTLHNIKKTGGLEIGGQYAFSSGAPY